MSFDVNATHGVVTARIVHGGYMDAAVAANDDSIAGFEFAASRMRAFDAPRSERHADLIVTVDCDRATMERLCVLLADKLGWQIHKPSRHELRPLEARTLTNDEADAIQRHLDEHGEDAVAYAIKVEAQTKLRLYHSNRVQGMSQQDALAAAEREIERS